VRGQRRSFERTSKALEGSLRLRTGAVFRAGAPRRASGCQIDWVGLQGAGVRIGGKLSATSLCMWCCVFELEWARVCYSESFLSLKIGLQSAAWELGGVNSSTATHELGRGRPGRGYNTRYLSLLAYYG